MSVCEGERESECVCVCVRESASVCECVNQNKQAVCKILSRESVTYKNLFKEQGSKYETEI